ncbi:MAG: FecR domain-containing protein [Deltaproteobacteria bacterium]|nr:FecR domain-containing protein [Deltaproteobacteria bacterium]
MRATHVVAVLGAILLPSLLSAPRVVRAEDSVVVLRKVVGRVEIRVDAKSAWVAGAEGRKVPDNGRVRTAAAASVELVFPDGSESRMAERAELIVHPDREKTKPSGVVLFFGRIWAKVAHRGEGSAGFEVRSANAVAGVRGTEFEVGVADDGSTRVIVSDGRVAVSADADDKEVDVGAGYEVEGDGQGRLKSRSKAGQDPKWASWFSARAKVLEKRGLEVAKNLNGRLDRRRDKVEKLLKAQKSLREAIERLEREAKMGRAVGPALKEKLAALERVTHRIEDMKRRLDAAFGMFERWGDVAGRGGFPGAKTLRAMAVDVSKIARDFADMIEEGTDLSEEGMEDMMEDMGKGKRDRPTQGADEELFR